MFFMPCRKVLQHHRPKLILAMHQLSCWHFLPDGRHELQLCVLEMPCWEVFFSRRGNERGLLHGLPTRKLCR